MLRPTCGGDGRDGAEHSGAEQRQRCRLGDRLDHDQLDPEVVVVEVGAAERQAVAPPVQSRHVDFAFEAAVAVVDTGAVGGGSGDAERQGDLPEALHDAVDERGFVMDMDVGQRPRQVRIDVRDVFEIDAHDARLLAEGQRQQLVAEQAVDLAGRIVEQPRPAPADAEPFGVLGDRADRAVERLVDLAARRCGDAAWLKFGKGFAPPPGSGLSNRNSYCAAAADPATKAETRTAAAVAANDDFSMVSNSTPPPEVVAPEDLARPMPPIFYNFYKLLETCETGAVGSNPTTSIKVTTGSVPPQPSAMRSSARIGALALDLSQPRDVAVVLVEGLGEGVAAGAVGDEIESSVRAGCSTAASEARPGIGDRPRRQAGDHVGVVGAGDLQIGAAERPVERPLPLR